MFSTAIALVIMLVISLVTRLVGYKKKILFWCLGTNPTEHFGGKGLVRCCRKNCRTVVAILVSNGKQWGPCSPKCKNAFTFWLCKIIIGPACMEDHDEIERQEKFKEFMGEEFSGLARELHGVSDDPCGIIAEFAEPISS